MFLKIKPNDTLFFRSGRPFSMGAETWADFIFPPNPSTVYGAIRTFLILQRGSLSKFLSGKMETYEDIGTKKQKGTLRIYGPFLYDEISGSILFPAPADLVKIKREGKEKFVKLSFQEKPKIFFSDFSLDGCLIFKEREKKVEEPEGFIEEISLKEYLEGKKTEFSLVKEVFKEELKIGIKRERETKTSEEAHIYRVPMLRFKKEISFLVELDGVKDFPEKGIFQLGAEGRTVNFKVIKENLLEELRNVNFELKNGIFKVYLATPAIFEKGWLPSWINEKNLKGEFKGLKLKLVTVVLKKHKLIGGWNLADNRPKPMYKAVPEGSVYYFKVLNGVDEEEIKKVFHFKNISDEFSSEKFKDLSEMDKFLSKEGFGLALIGGLA